MPAPTNSDTAPDPASGLQAIFVASPYMFPTAPGDNWETYVGGFTEVSDTQVVFRNTGGQTPFPSIAIDFPTVQVLVRGRQSAGGYGEGYKVAIAVRDALLGIPSGSALVLANYPALTSVRGMGHLQELGRDDKNRPQWSFNLSLIVSYDTSGYRTE